MNKPTYLPNIQRKNLKHFSFVYLETLVNDGWVKNTIVRLQTQGFSVFHIYKMIQVLGGKFGKHFFKMGPPNGHLYLVQTQGYICHPSAKTGLGEEKVIDSWKY